MTGFDDPHLFEPIGLSAADEEVYRTVLAAPGSTTAELAARQGHRAARTSRALSRLEGHGLVTRASGTPRRWAPAMPEAAVEILINRRMEQLNRLRLATDALMAQFRASGQGRDPGELVEIVSGAEASARRFAQVQMTVAEEMLVFDRPPYVQAGGNPWQRPVLARGVRWRAIYAPESLAPPGAPGTVQELRAAGEEARVLAGLPMKLVIADRRIALLPLVADDVIGQTIVVHPSSLLDSLVMLFEALWQRAIPFAEPPPPAAGGPAGEDRKLIELLAMGLKDDAIARQLGLSTRTTRRRMKALSDELGARNRFQAGMEAARRGWI
ncbi:MULTISPECIES: helix-turn-helix domain-containing protein [Thermomonosporaceae]|uniref:helix-turn-helix domain-containing protein n=1 Tax=Thermomonosporaceae TaxID=2012 RepID=UPI00255B0DDC|nr:MULTISPECIES: helix-turn-helix domain-containing protein [Thermomonosporaceae]MDL4774712.1 helix-turn-helix domain-containing protein [Actinomadura xylanilytica]